MWILFGCRRSMWNSLQLSTSCFSHLPFSFLWSVSTYFSDTWGIKSTPGNIIGFLNSILNYCILDMFWDMGKIWVQNSAVAGYSWAFALSYDIRINCFFSKVLISFYLRDICINIGIKAVLWRKYRSSKVNKHVYRATARTWFQLYIYYLLNLWPE